MWPAPAPAPPPLPPAPPGKRRARARGAQMHLPRRQLAQAARPGPRATAWSCHGRARAAPAAVPDQALLPISFLYDGAPPRTSLRMLLRQLLRQPRPHPRRLRVRRRLLHQVARAIQPALDLHGGNRGHNFCQKLIMPIPGFEGVSKLCDKRRDIQRVSVIGPLCMMSKVYSRHHMGREPTLSRNCSSFDAVQNGPLNILSSAGAHRCGASP